MPVEEIAKIKLECLKIAQQYSQNMSDLVKNAEALFKLVLN